MSGITSWRRRIAVAVFSILLVGGAGSASAAERPFELGLLVTPGASYNDAEGLDVDLGLGVGLGWWFGTKWGADGRLSFDDGSGVERRRLDLGLRRRLSQWQRWSSYGSLGVHFRETEIDRGPCGGPRELCLSAGPHREDEAGFFLGFALDRPFSERAGWLLDARYALYDSDASLDLSVGVSIRF